MRIAGRRINPIDAMLAVLLPVTGIGLYAEFNQSVSPQAVIRAAYRGDIAIVFENVNPDFDFLARGEHDHTLLHAAAAYGDADTVAYILANGGGVAMDTHDSFGYTPVHLSMGIRTPLGQVRNSTFPTFLEHGIDPNLKTNFREPLLWTAIESGREDFALMLLEAGANPNMGRLGGERLVTMITDRSMTDLLQAILERGASITLESSGARLLADAIMNGDPELVRVLLEHNADPNGRLTAEWPPKRARMGRGGNPWFGRGGSLIRRPRLFHDYLGRGIPVALRPLDLAMWYDLECAILLIEHGARAEVFPKVLIDALTW